MSTPPIPYKTPLTDKNGLPTAPWSAWFRQLFASVGGNDGVVLINPMTTLGDTLYQGSSGTVSLSGTISATKHFLTQTGTGVVSGSPAWGSIVAGDLPTGTATEVTSSVLILSNWTNATIGSPTVQVKQSSTTQSGFLSSTDWNTFNGKQASGSYLTALTGDATASGPGSAALTLATVNANTGSFGSSTAIPSLTLNAKGLVTGASTSAVIAPAGTVTGTTLASNVVTSSLTTVGTIGTGVWSGTTIAIAKGGTAATSAAAAFNNLSPMTTGGDIIYGGASGVGTRLANGSAGQVLSSQGTTLAPKWLTVAGAYIVPTQQAFTSGSAATYTRPAGLLYAKITVVGGGAGGGAGANVSGGAGGGGGGAGGTSIVWVSAATLGATQTYTVGAAGAAGPAGNPGTGAGSGGTSNVGTLASATGGSPGGSSTGTGTNVGAGGAGGVGSLGTTNIAGGGGSGGGHGITATIQGSGGAGGNSFLGGGGFGSADGNAGGAAGNYGAGGGGGSGAGAGGVGTAGYILFEEYYQ